MSRTDTVRETLRTQRERAAGMREVARRQRAVADALRDENERLLRRCRAHVGVGGRGPAGRSP
jgi:hypothetical protein